MCIVSVYMIRDIIIIREREGNETIWKASTIKDFYKKKGNGKETKLNRSAVITQFQE